MKLSLSKYDLLLLITLILALFATVFNSYHLPLGFDLYHNLIVACILSIGLTACFLLRFKEIKIPYSIITWMLLLGLIIIQPLIHNIAYSDYLIFPIGTLILIIILAIAIANIDDKKAFLNNYLMIFVGFMVLTVVIQLLQLRGYNAAYNDLVIFPAAISSRLDANFSQPNQAAFMLVLAQLACLYFYNLNKKKLWLTFGSLFIVGLALTSSRGGLILGLASIVLFNAFYNQPLVYKVRHSVLQLFGFLTAYLIGIFFIKNFEVLDKVSNSAIERFSKGSLDARLTLQDQAWLMFQENPLTGYGWGGFAKGSIDYATELNSFIFSKHSHFFLSQIASELGIIGLLCLIPITIFIVKKMSFKMDVFNAVCFTAISIIVLYSCSEFPLWFLRFLIIFIIFITLTDSKFICVHSCYSKVFTILALGSSVIILLYISSYLKIFNNIKYLAINDLTGDGIQEVYNDTPDVFGMSAFKESILFHYIPIDSNAIEGKLAIAKRVTAVSITQRGLFKYARLLALNKESHKSIAMFKAACAFNWKGDCDGVIKELEVIAKAEPQVYGIIKYEIDQWKVSFNPNI